MGHMAVLTKMPREATVRCTNPSGASAPFQHEIPLSVFESLWEGRGKPGSAHLASGHQAVVPNSYKRIKFIKISNNFLPSEG